MKRISFTAVVASCLMLTIVSSASAIDKTRTRTTNPVRPNNQFDPANLPGQGGINTLDTQSDPFLPKNIYNPFGPSTITPGLNGTTVPNPRPGTYPTDTSNQSRVRIQHPGTNYVPPGQGTSENRWRLGVLSRDTEAGVQIHEVLRDSAAARAGLEPDDIVVAVHGYQVGIVNGNLYEMSREFERHADQNGMVVMLVQDHRSRSLMNITVQLDSSFSRIEGSIALNNNQFFPRNGRVIVELQEIVRQGAAPLTIAHKEIDSYNPNIRSIPFELQYDPNQISHRGDYVISAQVYDQGRSTYKTLQTFRANSQGYGDGRPVAMRLDPVRPGYDSPIQIDQDSQIATIVKWFNEYLGRPPSDRELTVWLDALGRGYTLKQVQLELLGHNQFFNRCGRDKLTYITQIHRYLVGRDPSPAEQDYWLGRYDAQGGIRRELAREFQDAVGIR